MSVQKRLRKLAKQEQVITEEDLRLLGPVKLQHTVKARTLEIGMPVKMYTKLLHKCEELNARCARNDIELIEKITPESLVFTLIHWFVTTGGDQDIIGPDDQKSV